MALTLREGSYHGGPVMIVLGRDGAQNIVTGEILASGSFLSDAFDVSQVDGFFSLQWGVTGDGTLKVEALCALDGINFHDIADDIAAAQTKTSGIGGVNMDSFTIPPCLQMKLKFSETGGISAIDNVAAILHAR
jgi:hypothetical protein